METFRIQIFSLPIIEDLQDLQTLCEVKHAVIFRLELDTTIRNLIIIQLWFKQEIGIRS